MRPAPVGDADFAVVVRCTPLISIDLLIRDAQRRTLVGLRVNEPAKGTYFVPGGVIRKNERIHDAFVRILKAETGLSANFSDAEFRGVYEHIYGTNRFGDAAYGTHYVVLAYALAFASEPEVRPDNQHRTFRWMSAAELLSAPEVHDHTKAYFR